MSYLQPAETRPGLLEVLAATPGVVPYFDLSFQHAAPTVLRRMRRFGGTDASWSCWTRIRAQAPEAGVALQRDRGLPRRDRGRRSRSSSGFLEAARLDVVGVFGYSDEDGTEAAALHGTLDEDVVAERVARVGALVEDLMDQRGAERVGERVEVLVEEVAGEDGRPVGRAAHQGPDVDGVDRVGRGSARQGSARQGGARRGPVVAVGDLVRARVVSSSGADLVAQVLPGPDQADRVTTSGAAPEPVQAPAVPPAPSAWNIANGLTLLRLLLVPVFGWLSWPAAGTTRCCACSLPVPSPSRP